MEQWVQRARAQLVAMSAKLFDHAQAKDSLASGMVKKVKPNQAGVQFLIVSGRASHYPNPLS